jgi:hypothetical protein
MESASNKKRVWCILFSLNSFDCFKGCDIASHLFDSDLLQKFIQIKDVNTDDEESKAEMR